MIKLYFLGTAAILGILAGSTIHISAPAQESYSSIEEKCYQGKIFIKPKNPAGAAFIETSLECEE